MEELTLTTPALLFSAVSLILLAYTNRFLSYAQLPTDRISSFLSLFPPDLVTAAFPFILTLPGSETAFSSASHKKLLYLLR